MLLLEVVLLSTSGGARMLSWLLQRRCVRRVCACVPLCAVTAVIAPYVPPDATPVCPHLPALLPR